MSMTDSTQLKDDVIAHVSLCIDTPMARAEWSPNGSIHLSVGGVLLTFSPESAAAVAASLATAAQTALLNNTLKLVRK